MLKWDIQYNCIGDFAKHRVFVPRIAAFAADRKPARVSRPIFLSHGMEGSKIMSRLTAASLGILLLAIGVFANAEDAKPVKKYFGHPVVEDRYGVVAPWYKGQNGQCDFRLRISEETLKRYPWTEPGKSAMQGPHYIFNGTWTIKPDGAISIDTNLKDWDNGDVGQRSFSLLLSQTDYYRYSGDPAALGIITMTADNVLDNCLTPADHPWPKFFISCPIKGKAYHQADPHGFIQLDISAYVGSGMVSAYKITGNERYWEAAKHWADLFAEHCNLKPGEMPWPRYANPEDITFQACERPNRQRFARLPVPGRRDSNGLRGQRRFVGESPRRRRKISSRRPDAEMERLGYVRPRLLGLGQCGLYLRRC